MTYAMFLVIFLGIPLVIMSLATYRDWQTGRTLPAQLSNLPAWIPVVVHIFLALIYTTPWDNYLVATGVWYYEPKLVTGITLGWVPIEEYTFFILQTLLTGLWVVWLARRLPLPIIPESKSSSASPLRRNATLVIGLLWLGSLGLFLSGWKPGTYLSLILVWALPPIILQLAFGSDLLWRYRRWVALSLFTVTLYLGLADSLAISAGTWTIAPGQSLNIFVAGVLPLEELIFFFLTNTLIVFGTVLTLTCESRQRARALFHFRFSIPAIPGLEEGHRGDESR